MLLSLMDDPNRIAVQGKVVWITPEGVQGNRTQGIGVQFTQDETGATARSTIEQILGETLASVAPDPYDVAASAALWRPVPIASICARGVAGASNPFETPDVRRFPLSSRFPRIRRGIAGAARRDGGGEVTHALCIGVNLPDWPAVHALAVAHPNLYATVGVHPDAENTTEPTVDTLVELAARPKVVAIGETGLDYYRLEGDLGWQRERFRVHIRAACAPECRS
jgi:hypothetical protein